MNTTENPQDDPDEGLSDEKVLANHFFDLYKGLDRAYGKFKLNPNATEEGDKVKGRATTEIGFYHVKLWNLHLSGEQGLGVIPIQDDGTCWWGAIDIDVYPLDLEELERKVRALGLPLLVVRTKSGGAHLTLFLSEPVPCKLVRGRLYEFAMALGYGGVEIFPKQTQLASNKDVGNWLNMPYFSIRDTRRYCVFKGQPLPAKQFLVLAHRVRITEEQLKDIEVKLSGDFEDGPPCLQMMTKQGIPEGTRNNTLFAMGVYCKMKYVDEWEPKLEEMNSTHLQPPLKSKEVQTIIRSANQKNYFYPCNKSPLNQFCNRDLCRKRPFGVGQNGEDFSLNLGSLIKVSTEPPIWIIDIEGVRVQLDTEDIMMQERFRRACVMSINKLPPLIKRNDWEKILREKLENVEIVDAPVESRQASRINQYAYEYLMRTPPAKVRDEVLLGRPWYDKDSHCIIFRGNDLLRYLENNGVRSEARKIWTSLREQGTTHSELKIKGQMVQIWSVPKDLVPDVSIDLPEDLHDQF